MGELKKVDKPHLQGQDPTRPFFMAISVGNLDGSIDDIGGEGVEGLFNTEAEAVAVLKDLNESYPSLDGYVFHVVPVKRVWRGRIKVTPVPKAFTPKERLPR